MIESWVNKNYELAQLEHIREARENLRIALEAEKNCKKAGKKEAVKDFLAGMFILILFVDFLLLACL